MTIKELAAEIGVSDKAIYKRLKHEGIDLAELKISGSSALLADGEARIRDLYSSQDPAGDEPEETFNQVEDSTDEVENSTKQVENSTGEVEKEVERLKKEVERLEELNKALTDERDFLRISLERTQTALDRSQQLQAITAAKIPNPRPALPEGKKPGRIRSWIERHILQQETKSDPN